MNKKLNVRHNRTILALALFITAGAVYASFIYTDSGNNELPNVVSTTVEDVFDKTEVDPKVRVVNSGSDPLQYGHVGQRFKDDEVFSAPHVTPASSVQPVETYIGPLELELKASRASDAEATNSNPKLDSGPASVEDGGSGPTITGDDSESAPDEPTGPELPSDVSPVKDIPIKSATSRRGIGNSQFG